MGIPPSFGGPYLGLFASSQQYIRQMPSRLSGRTVDRRGRVGYVLTLQTREQHIRRERATSNICTNEALYALASTIYLAALGKQGLRQVAELCYHKAHYAASRIAQLPGYSLPIHGTFFQEFVVLCPDSPATINRRLLEKNILGGLDISVPPWQGDSPRLRPPVARGDHRGVHQPHAALRHRDELQRGHRCPGGRLGGIQLMVRGGGDRDTTKLLMERSVPAGWAPCCQPWDVPAQALPEAALVRTNLDLPEISEPEVVHYFTALSQLNFPSTPIFILW